MNEIWKLLDEALADIRVYLDRPKKETVVNLFGT